MSEIIESAFQMAIDKYGLNGIDSLSEIEKVVVSVFSLEIEINNGGFDQYYYNSSGDFAYYAPEGLRIIGAPKTAIIVEKANSIFGGCGPDKDYEKRISKLNKLDGKYEGFLEELDDEFYEYPHDLNYLLVSYLSNGKIKT